MPNMIIKSQFLGQDGITVECIDLKNPNVVWVLFRPYKIDENTGEKYADLFPNDIEL